MVIAPTSRAARCSGGSPVFIHGSVCASAIPDHDAAPASATTLVAAPSLCNKLRVALFLIAGSSKLKRLVRIRSLMRGDSAPGHTTSAVESAQAAWATTIAQSGLTGCQHTTHRG